MRTALLFALFIACTSAQSQVKSSPHRMMAVAATSTMVENTTQGLVAIPAIYGGGNIAAGDRIIIASPVLNVEAAFALTAPRGLRFTAVSPGQQGERAANQPQTITGVLNVNDGLTLGHGVLGSAGNGPGLCAPPSIDRGGSAGSAYTPFAYSPGSACPGFPYGYTVLDTELSNGDVTIDGLLDEGSDGQVLYWINEGGGNLYLWNNDNSDGWPFLLENYHQAWLGVTESSVVVLKFGPDRYGFHWWQVESKADNALSPIRDLSPGSANSISLSSCGGSGAAVASSGGSYSGAFTVGSGATSCMMTTHISNASGSVNCFFATEGGVPVAWHLNSLTPSGVWDSGDPVTAVFAVTPGSGAASTALAGQTVHFFCNLAGG